MNNDEMMTAEEVAQLLRVKIAWVWEHTNGRRRPQLPSVKYGTDRRSPRRFLRSQIVKFIEEQQQV